jgi:deoxyribodipyrimidine photo-lyase
MALNLWWIRRDLRLADNAALRGALENGTGVLPVFILDPALLRAPAERRQAFLFAGLRRLDADLRQRGSRLVVRSGSPVEALARLAAESGAQAVWAAADSSPYALRRDAAVALVLDLHLVQDVTVHPPQAVLKPDGRPYTVFTPYSKAWKALTAPEILAADGAPWQPPARLPAVVDVVSEALPVGSAADEAAAPDIAAVLRAFPPGEAEAARRLEQFLAGPIDEYASQRDRLDLDGTSTLSPYLRFGMLPVRQTARAARQAAESAPTAEGRRGCEVWLNELIWREFYHAILYHFPFVLKQAFNPRLRAVPWRDVQGEARDDFAAWQAGCTGFPVVDACMRQLNTLGWMHNRGRMIVASFLAKDLLINWQEGERYFMRQLVDGDPAANNGGWQWTAGTGTDAAPYFRVFSPVLQGKKFDPRGAFIRRWLPELAHLPDELLHEPWRAPQPVAGYPAPIVDHAMARVRALRAYKNE